MCAPKRRKYFWFLYLKRATLKSNEKLYCFALSLVRHSSQLFVFVFVAIFDSFFCYLLLIKIALFMRYAETLLGKSTWNIIIFCCATTTTTMPQPNHTCLVRSRMRYSVVIFETTLFLGFRVCVCFFLRRCNRFLSMLGLVR